MSRTPYIVDMQRLGGAHGSLSAKWNKLARNVWLRVPDPGLRRDVRELYGPDFGEVRFDPVLKLCVLDVRSRHGRTWRFTEPARTPDEARNALSDKIEAATANPAWVSGFDDFYAPSDPADDMTPCEDWNDPYPFEWCDRMAAAINRFTGLNTPASLTLSGCPRAPWRRAHDHLVLRCGQLEDVMGRKVIDRQTREGTRAYELLRWGKALLSINMRSGAPAVGVSVSMPLASLAMVAKMNL